MKITIISNVFPYPKSGILPGIERYAENLVEIFKILDIEIKIVTSFWNGGTRHDLYKGVPILRIYETRKLFGKLGSLFRLNHISFGLNLFNKRNFTFFKDSDLIIMLQPFGFSSLFKLKKIPVITIAHHFQHSTMFQEYFELPFFHLLQKNQYYIHRNIVAVSETTKKDIVDYFSLNPKDVRVIPTAVNSEIFNPINKDRSIKVKYGDNILIYAGPFIYRKRILDIIKAMPEVLSEVPNAVLFLVGDGLYLDKCKSLSNQLGVSNNVIFFGFVEFEVLLGLIASSDIFIFPSEKEGCPQILLEAMANQLPIICANIYPMSEIIGNGGITFRVHDSRDLAKKIIYLLKNKEERMKLGKNALEIIRKKYELKQVANEFLKLFKDLNVYK